MRLDLDRERLTKAVTFAARALPKSALHPALNGLRVTATKAGVLVSAFDYDTYAEANAGPAEQTVDVLLPGRVFAAYLAGLAGPQVRVEIDEHDVTLTAGSAKVALRTMRLDDYPSAPALPASVGTVDATALATALGFVKDSVGVGEGVQPLEGIRIEALDGTLTVAGVSRYRLSARDLPGWRGDADLAATVPLSVADSAKAFTDEVVIGYDNGRVSLGDADQCLSVRTIAGDPPSWRRLLDAHNGTLTVEIDRRELVSAVRWVAAGDTDRRTARVRLEVGDQLVGVARLGADGPDAATDVAAKVDGDPLVVGFNRDYLLDGLAATDAATLTLTFATATKPVRVTADADPGFRALVMPVKLT